jgi:hypothetical protein
MSNAPSSETPLPLDTQLLLALLDLKTERLLNECEALIEAIANREAAEAAQEARERSLA